MKIWGAEQSGGSSVSGKQIDTLVLAIAAVVIGGLILSAIQRRYNV